MPKLGRVYLDKPSRGRDAAPEAWTRRLQRLLSELERQVQPNVVLIDSRSGIHDLSAAAVTDLGADVLLFARADEPAWTGYAALFGHWRDYGVAPSLRDRLHVVAAQIPPNDVNDYLEKLRQAS